jgi:hypothetical protein
MIPKWIRGARLPAPDAAHGGDVMMDFGTDDVAIILGLSVILILLGSFLWRLHSAADTISKGRRFR